MNRKSILSKIKDDDEKIIVAKAIDKRNVAIKRFTPEFSEFIDPYKATLIKELLFSNECEILVYGGHKNAERVKVGFFPEFCEVKIEDFPISIVEIKYNAKYSRALSHRDFLGSILCMGINRDKIGDIIIEDGYAIVYAEDEIARYIEANLEKVGNTSVRVKILDYYKPKEKDVVEKKITLASMRLDVVISGAFNISRGKVAELIKGEKAFINWKNITSSSHKIEENDLITLRGVGRVKINEILGNTKKDRILVSISIFK